MVQSSRCENYIAAEPKGGCAGPLSTVHTHQGTERSVLLVLTGLEMEQVEQVADRRHVRGDIGIRL